MCNVRSRISTRVQSRHTMISADVPKSDQALSLSRELEFPPAWQAEGKSYHENEQSRGLSFLLKEE